MEHHYPRFMRLLGVLLAVLASLAPHPWAVVAGAALLLAAAEVEARRSLNAATQEFLDAQAHKLRELDARLDAEVAGVPKTELVKTVNAMAADVLAAKKWMETQQAKAGAQAVFGGPRR